MLDPFAETGLSPTERRKVMLRSFGYPGGIRMYVRRDCAGPLRAGLPARDLAVFGPHTEEWSPAGLIGRFRDVTRCDHCGREFRPADDGYMAYWVVPAEGLRQFAEVRQARTPERHA